MNPCHDPLLSDCCRNTLTFDRDRYLSMVRDRYMSLLAGFTDAELDRGITEIRERFPGDRLEFPDRFAFIRGTSARAGAAR